MQAYGRPLVVRLEGVRVHMSRNIACCTGIAVLEPDTAEVVVLLVDHQLGTLQPLLGSDSQVLING